MFCSKGKVTTCVSTFSFLWRGDSLRAFHASKLCLVTYQLESSISSFMVGEYRYGDMIVTMRRKRGYAILERLIFSS